MLNWKLQKLWIVKKTIIFILTLKGNYHRTKEASCLRISFIFAEKMWDQRKTAEQKDEDDDKDRCCEDLTRS